MYVWTKKAEKRAEELGLEKRKEGKTAMFGYEELGLGEIATAWKEKGYIKEGEK